MSQSFTHSADNLQSFFSQPGRGFYVPYYQRSYSWDDENAEKLITDIFSGIRRTLTKPNNSIFLGTVILHDEKNVAVGVHTDTPNLLTKVSNVVDGQQRITSLAMLACVLSDRIARAVGQLKAVGSFLPEIMHMITELENEQHAILEFYSVEIRKNGAQPKIKPLIIRAGEATSNPVSDQWTLAGNGRTYYRSNTSGFLSDFIDGIAIKDIKVDDRIGSVISVFLNEIENEMISADLSLAQKLLTANATQDGSLAKFMAYPPDLLKIQQLSTEEQKLFYGCMLLFAACHFLKNSCHLVVIECLDLALAFDMFQSLNATGTPLTAFEVFKPVVVKEWAANYGQMVKPEVDRIERVFETESTASGKEDLTDRIIVSSAMVYNGKIISPRFSQERDWLCDTFDTLKKPPNTESKELIMCLADQADYYQRFIAPRRSPKNSSTFSLINHLCSFGLNAQQADLAAFCIFYLRDAGHQFAHSVISVFYAKLLRAQGNTASVATAAAEFLSICKAAASFFTLWMGTLQGRFPDSDYRKLFEANGNITMATGSSNQTEVFVKSAFRNALEAHKVYDAGSAANARVKWVNEAKQTPWYTRKAVCRFALFISSNDAATDLTAGNEGLFTDGKAGSATLLSSRAWHASDYEVIEHVATSVTDRFKTSHSGSNQNQPV